MHGPDSPMQNKSLPAQPGYIFISHFVAISNSFHSCIYIQIFFPSDLKLKTLQSCSRWAKQGRILSTMHGLQFHPQDSAAPLELCFCVLWHEQKHLTELPPCIWLQTALSIIRLFAKRRLWTYPQCTGKKNLDKTGRGSTAFFLFLQSRSLCYLVPKLPLLQ